MFKEIHSVTTMTPQRISFVGGGTDLPDFYRINGGSVLSSTINKYIYVTVKRHSKLFEENYRLSYSITEHVNSIQDIQNEIARECLNLINIDGPLYISTAADLPAQSGLGSSSSFAVGLLHALHVMRGENVSAIQLAEEACYIEINRLKRPIGKQDQYAAAFGGLNFFEFQKNENVKILPIALNKDVEKILFNDALLFWTGMQRESQTILSVQAKGIKDNIEILEKMAKQAEQLQNDLQSNNINLKKIAQYIKYGWELKESLAEGITNKVISDAYKEAINSGAEGGKLLGAGGGGFLYFLAEKIHHEKIITTLNQMPVVPVKFEPRGSAVTSILRV